MPLKLTLYNIKLIKKCQVFFSDFKAEVTFILQKEQILIRNVDWEC